MSKTINTDRGNLSLSLLRDNVKIPKYVIKLKEPRKYLNNLGNQLKLLFREAPPREYVQTPSIMNISFCIQCQVRAFRC